MQFCVIDLKEVLYEEIVTEASTRVLHHKSYGLIELFITRMEENCLLIQTKSKTDFRYFSDVYFLEILSHKFREFFALVICIQD